MNAAQANLPPHIPHWILLVAIDWASAIARSFIKPSCSRNVPLSKASSRNWALRRSFWLSGISIPCLIISLIFLTALSTHSAEGAEMKACRGSSSPGKGSPSLLPTLPSLTEPFPRIITFAPV